MKKAFSNLLVAVFKFAWTLLAVWAVSLLLGYHPNARSLFSMALAAVVLDVLYIRVSVGEVVDYKLKLTSEYNRHLAGMNGEIQSLKARNYTLKFRNERLTAQLLAAREAYWKMRDERESAKEPNKR